MAASSLRKLVSTEYDVDSIYPGRQGGKFLSFRKSSRFCSNGRFQCFYSTEARSTFAEDNKRESSCLSDEVKALHSLYIKDIYKDRIAPIIPFDTNFILDSSSNFSDAKERFEFLKK